jgi:hypothetical protein
LNVLPERPYGAHPPVVVLIYAFLRAAAASVHFEGGLLVTMDRYVPELQIDYLHAEHPECGSRTVAARGRPD